MSRILSVYIEKNGKQEYVGKIVGDSSVDACFSYDDSYIEKNGKPISISLPLEEKAFDEKRTRYFFEGLLPEGFTRIMYRFIVQQLTAAGAKMCQGIFFVLYYLILKIKYLLKVYGKIELRKNYQPIHLKEIYLS